ncbi:MAG: sigma-70 family RNA polymerase sigma factor [Pseudohongiellaceae bacterium]
MALIKDDDALIAAALKGSTYAWDKLVRRYEGRVYNYGLRLTGNPTDAMDLMQEVFLGVCRNLHKFRGDSKFSSWLFRIAHNKAVDMRRRRWLLQQHGSIGVDEIDELDMQENRADCGPESSLISGQQNRRIRKLLEGLPMDQRLVVELKFFQFQTFEEIADMQDISVNTAKTRFYSALKKLKAAMEEEHVLS